MNEENLTKLDEILRDDLNNYEKFGFNDQEKMKACAVIAKEASILSTEKKDEREEKRFVKQNELEREKFKFEKKIRLAQLKNDKEFKKMELEFRKASLDLEIQRNKDNEKHNKIQLILSIVGIAAPCLIDIIAKCIYAGLTVNAQRHDYEDYKIESSSSKEQRNNLLKK